VKKKKDFNIDINTPFIEDTLFKFILEVKRILRYFTALKGGNIMAVERWNEGDVITAEHLNDMIDATESA
jgi:hypothetical protein